MMTTRAIVTETQPTTTDSEICNNCGKQFNEGDGISGYDGDGYRKSYDWDCAIGLGIAVDEFGNLTDREV